ncbi:MAG: hypothetical protein QOF13_1150 [Solirubrobacterales bacterium]|jgi:hypothetical protein|nr:hypothetical protein [Solirubrobacterales bacterium]
MAPSKRVPSLLATCAIVALTIAGVLAPTTQAAPRHIDGTVVSKNAKARTFKLSTQSGTVQIKVNGNTQFERIAGGFSGLHKGLAIEVEATSTSNGLIAKKVEPRGGGGGGGSGGGSDNGPNHT